MINHTKPIETTFAYLLLLAERDGREEVVDWLTETSVLNSFAEGESVFFMMADSSIVIFTELEDNQVNAVAFATPSKLRDSIRPGSPEFANVDPKMVAELARLDEMVEQVVRLLDPANQTGEVGHA